MSQFRFAPASSRETHVFGAERPGYPARVVGRQEVADWIDFMKQRDIRRVVCLLPENQLSFYASLPGGLLQAYREAFGSGRVHHEPVEDCHLCTPGQLRSIIGFLDDALRAEDKVVVHCSGGVGRTGHVLAGWLVHRFGLDGEAAISMVRQAERNAEEAVTCGRAARSDLLNLLETCRRAP